jgi:hypothetical protein
MAHFDFVVANVEDMPLFAVEFDGPRHRHDSDAIRRDHLKNELCERLGLALARVTDEHLFRGARGINYVQWLAELYFGFDTLSKAQERGELPFDEPLDPLSFMSIGHLPGSFPLFLSANARTQLLHKHQVIPSTFSGESRTGMTGCLAVLSIGDMKYLAESSIYLRGFGTPPNVAAEEIAVVSLANMLTMAKPVSTGVLRSRLIRFLHQYPTMSAMSGGSVELGFSLSYRRLNGVAWWQIGSLGDQPAVQIEAAP